MYGIESMLIKCCPEPQMIQFVVGSFKINFDDILFEFQVSNAQGQNMTIQTHRTKQK